ncbi:AAA family ATPase [Pseudomonas entomophila]|uniref:AAA family ATPase n=1 Tax=Pseudomonas entomophila TaxID=312306 RepID=UPI0015E42234|nr:AAA family ATPase [Pseudomonas entomophila]MBA1187976.1 AAA family ATPase [Pseudomonas entomophila]
MHIVSMSTFNIFGSVETRTVELDSPVVILTGYNGAGKSTFLGVLHSTLSVASGQEYLFPKSDWGCSVKFSNDSELIHVKTGRSLPDGFSPPTFRKTRNGDSLKNYYESINGAIDDRIDKKNVIVKREGEGRVAQSTSIVSMRAGKGAFSVLNSVLYGDEVFSSKQDDLDSKKFEGLDIFSKKKNLDKTFFLLQAEFSTHAKGSSGSSSSELINLIENTLKALGSLDKNESEELRAHIATLKKLRDAKLVSNPLVKEANLFFASTNRELKIRDNGFLYMETVHGEVNWYDFSKGEKTLLCLLLVAYLNGDKKTVFLLDEPDLSLHIKWQRQLIPSLRALAPNSRYIVATHSPALVGRTDEEIVINIGAISRS